ncbi:gamma-glutamylcyclotransferase family protein [Halomonas salipaludis]|uniref:Gamma-glutamylcyclotransferase family protein n=1 Tax=Halomonas salipaludis TaxID=2032625 RepID=A0A2A2F040_9GAMM|nr:gamma-glutamylcyclotransferase family protein [Halomonas salipaludis]PAU78308.1 gamma-glutamylcyclotransferase [Halomonas salipaludis]
MSHLLFVYGTLKRGFANHAGYLGEAEFLDLAVTCEPFPLVLNGPRYSPVLVDAQGQGLKVQGELFRVDAPTLDELDRLERVNDRDGYRRRRLAIADPHGQVQAAWSYLKPPSWVEDVRSEPMAVYDDRRYRPRPDA